MQAIALGDAELRPVRHPGPIRERADPEARAAEPSIFHPVPLHASARGALQGGPARSARQWLLEDEDVLFRADLLEDLRPDA